MEKKKSVITIIVFLLLLFGLAALHLLLPDDTISTAERRKLQQVPELTVKTVFSGEYMDDLESYLLDQFPVRDGFRSLKARLRFDLFRQLDNNDIYLVDGYVSKLLYPLEEGQIQYCTEKFNELQATYLQDMHVYYTIVPDKNYYMAEENGYPVMDYARLETIMQSQLPQMTYIEIFDCLELEDYYRTDPHWRQEALGPVVQRLAEGMGVEDALLPMDAYTAESASPFYGSYYGQSALTVDPEEILYLTSAGTDSAVVTSVEDTDKLSVYAPEKINGTDGYDIFLHGAKALLTIENPNAATDRELIIFRDSFGSSLAPLFVDTYAKITLVDIRYISSALLADYVEFTPGQDVLFLYNTSLLNSSTLLK